MRRKRPAQNPREYIHKIISGGQTGADRAALDAAIELGIDHGGWVPRGRRAEDGRLPRRYRVQETSSFVLPVRTEWNVRDADATLIVSRGPLTGGSALTRRLAKQYGKPVLHIDLKLLSENKALDRLRRWLEKIRPSTLNVAGPRHSGDAQIYECVWRLLKRLFLEYTEQRSSQ